MPVSKGINDKVLAALSTTEKRGTLQICEITGINRKSVTASLNRLRAQGLVANVGVASGNDTARYIATGATKETKISQIEARYNFVVPKFPTWLAAPVHRPIGEVRQVMWD